MWVRLKLNSKGILLIFALLLNVILVCSVAPPKPDFVISTAGCVCGELSSYMVFENQENTTHWRCSWNDNAGSGWLVSDIYYNNTCTDSFCDTEGFVKCCIGSLEAGYSYTGKIAAYNGSELNTSDDINLVKGYGECVNESGYGHQYIPVDEFEDIVYEEEPETMMMVFRRGGSINEILKVYNPTTYGVLLEQLELTFQNQNFHGLPDNLWKSFRLFVLYVFKEPAMLVPSNNVTSML